MATQSTPTTTPAATGSAAPERPTLSPELTIAGRSFDLTKIDAKKGAELRAALPEEYRAKVDALVPFFENYRLEISNLPAELIAPGGVQKLMKAIKDGGGQLAADAPEWMKQSVSTLSENTAVKSAQGVYDFFKTLSDAGGQFKDGLTWSLRGITALAGAAGDAASSYGKISHEQAVALAATYEAAIYKMSQTPEAGFLDKGIAGLETAMSWVLHTIYNFWPSGAAFLLAVKNFAVDGFKDWSQAYAAADQALKQEGGPQSYSTLLKRDLLGKVNADAAKDAATLLSQVGPVAGVSSAPLYQTLNKDDAIIVGQDQKVYGVHKGKVDANPLPGPDGKPLEGKDLTASRLHYVRGSLFTDKDPLSVPNLAGAAGLALGTTGAIATVGLAGAGLRTTRDTFQHAPLKRLEDAWSKRHAKIESAVETSKAAPRTWDPRTWLRGDVEKATARAAHFDALAAKEEASALARGISPDAIAAAKKAIAEGTEVAVASKPSFFASPISWAMNKTGSMFGWVGDTAARTVGGSVSQAQRLGGEVAELATKPFAAAGEASTLVKPFAFGWTATKGVVGFGLRRFGEVGMVLGAVDDTRDAFHSAGEGDGVGATRATGRVLGGVGGTLAGGALANSINGTLGFTSAATAASTAAVTTEVAAGTGLLATAAKGGLEGAKFGKIGRLPGMIIGGTIGIGLATAGYFLGRHVVGETAEGVATLATGHGPRVADPGITAAVTERAQKAAKLVMANATTGLGALQQLDTSAGTLPPAGARRPQATEVAPA